MRSVSTAFDDNPTVTVCDALMGSGKTEAAITYINEHPEKKFIYITPYLSEAERIKKGCPEAHFAEPSNKIPDANFRKVNHSALLINEGRNIASTHSAFRRYNKEMLDDIKRQNYTLIIDESLDVLCELPYKEKDISYLEELGCVKKTDTTYYIDSSCREYEGELFRGFIDAVKTRDILWSKTGNQALYCWLLPVGFIKAFREVIVMTYLFEGQEMSCYLQMNGLHYEKIGVRREPDGTYRFGNYQEYIPDYVKSLPDKIHFLEHPKLDHIGDDRFALSMSWFKKEPDLVKQLKNNVLNVFMNIWKDEAPSGDRMWGTFKEGEHKIRGRGYSKRYVVFNARATNEYSNRTHLAYVANVFVNAGHRNLFKQHGVDLNEDLYALSFLIQWIWRSAIRNGKDIYLYIPSSRMRTLLTEWINVVSKGGDAGWISAKNVCTEESYALLQTPATIAGITSQ